MGRHSERSRTPARQAEPAGLSVVAIVAVAGLATWLLASISGGFGHHRSSPVPKDPVLTLAQANGLAARDADVASEPSWDLASLARPLQSLVAAVSALPTEPGTAGQFVDPTDAALNFSGQLNPTEGRPPATAMATEQRELPPSELAAKQSGVDSLESQFADDQTKLESLQSMLAAHSAASSTGTVTGTGTNGADAILGSYTTASTATKPAGRRPRGPASLRSRRSP
jgi:hypothetical protein